MLKVGLTGGIGSGKSTVSHYFAELGVPIIDADVIAREVVEPGKSALREIAALFGDHLLDDEGKLRRSQLRKIIFADPNKRKQLEAILHPRIRQRMLELAEQCRHQHDYAIFSIPLLLESGWQALLDRVVIVDIEESRQLERTCQRDGTDEKAAREIINSQISRQDRLLAADDVIDNNGDLIQLKQQVVALHNKFRQLCYSR